LLRSRRKHKPLVRLALALSAAALLMASTAAADDPIVTIGETGGNGLPTASGTVGDEGTADACLNDDHSGVDSSETSPIALNDSNCTSSNSTTTSSRPTSTTTPTSTTGPRGSATWVLASSALGLRIVGVRTVLTGVRSTKRFRVVVTLRDLNGKLVRGAIVRIDRVPGAVNTIRGRDAAFTNRVGKARLVASVATKQLGTRVLLRVTARTPKARALQLRSVFVR
jgi:hypothetical protein